MKIYISGKITGIEEEARVNFEVAEHLIRSLGHEPVNPFKLRHKANATWEDYMRKDIRELTKCDAIWMMPDWKNSRGAVVEFQLATELKMIKIYQLHYPQPTEEATHRIEIKGLSVSIKQAKA